MNDGASRDLGPRRAHVVRSGCSSERWEVEFGGWLGLGRFGGGVPASDDGADDLRVDGVSVSGGCGPDVSAGFGLFEAPAAVGLSVVAAAAAEWAAVVVAGRPAVGAGGDGVVDLSPPGGL